MPNASLVPSRYVSAALATAACVHSFAPGRVTQQLRRQRSLITLSYRLQTQAASREMSTFKKWWESGRAAGVSDMKNKGAACRHKCQGNQSTNPAALQRSATQAALHVSEPALWCHCDTVARALQSVLLCFTNMAADSKDLMFVYSAVVLITKNIPIVIFIISDMSSTFLSGGDIYVLSKFVLTEIYAWRYVSF